MADDDDDIVERMDRETEAEGTTSLEIATFSAVQNKVLHMKYESVSKYSGTDVRSDSLSTKIQVPDAPPGVHIDENIKKARESFNPFWFIEMVRKDGPWDYKKIDTKYEDFGNFNYGATALAFGFQEKWALQAAGIVHVLTNTAQKDWKANEYKKSILDFGVSFQGPPYGDDPDDQRMIKAGFRYYQEIYRSRYPESGMTKDDVLRIAEGVFTGRHAGSETIAKWILDVLE